MIVLPLTGAVDVTIGDTTHALAGRESVFAAVTDTAYLPINSSVRLASRAGGTIALPGARADRSLPFRFQPAAAVDVSLRGSGSSTRQVNNFGMGAGLECVNLLATEVLTPASNWSSYPPHKHDENNGTETELEEVYYYRFASAAPVQQEAARAVRNARGGSVTTRITAGSGTPGPTSPPIHGCRSIQHRQPTEIASTNPTNLQNLTKEIPGE
jgi:5-deoxy-glucuronate isomerase